MLMNFLAVGWRRLGRDRLFAFVSVTGLSLGLACCILMGLFVAHEWSFDRFHEYRDDLYRVIRREVRSDGGVEFQPLQDMDLAPRMAEEIPEVMSASRLILSKVLVSKDDRAFEEQVLLADPSALGMFTFPLLAGQTLPDQVSGVLLVESLAKRLLGNDLSFQDMVGQTVMLHGWSEKFPRTVVGVLRSIPTNSSLQFAAVLPFEARQSFTRRQTMDGFTSTWVRLRSDIDLGVLSIKLDRLVTSLFAEKLEKWKADGHIADSPGSFQLRLQPLGEVHFDEKVLGGYESKGRVLYGRILAGLAGVVLLLACVNFASLSASRTAGRISEVGIRKSVGATRGHIVRQHILEAFMVTFLSVGLGLVLAEWASPHFGQLTSKSLSLMSIPVLLLLGGLLALALVTAFAAGAYPAFLLSRAAPSQVLKGGSPIGRGHVVIRVLLTVQIAVSVTFIAGTYAMSQQLSYIYKKGLGFDEQQLLAVRLGDPRASKMAETIKNEMLRGPGVLSATLSDRVLVGGNVTYGMLKPDGARTKVRVLKVDNDYLKTMRISLLAGRDFSAGTSDDVIINTQLAEEMGWAAPLGQLLPTFPFGGNRQVVGVVEDFHVDSLYEPIYPAVLHMDGPLSYGAMFLRISPGTIEETIKHLKDTWADAVPDIPIDYAFLDQRISDQYRNDAKWGHIVGSSALFAIFIAAMGLVGHVSLSIVRRTKEIGIRRVLGVTASGLVLLLSKDFVRVLAIGNALAAPVICYAVGSWLDHFAYRIDLSITPFAVGGVVATLIVFSILAGLGTQVARSNLVAALHTE